MEEFLPSLKEQHPLELKQFTHIEETLQKLIALRIDQADGIALSPVSRFPVKVAILLQVGLRRTIELTGAAIREANRVNIVSPAVLTRAAFETGCLLYDMMRRLEDMVQQNDVGALEAFDKNITSTILGHGQKAKTFVLAEEYVVQNILTIIQRLSKQCDAPFDGFYEALCEYAHPNYIGMMGVYTQSDDSGGLTTFTDGRTSRTNPTTFIWMGALATSLDLVGNSLERWQDSSKRLAAFAERRSYEQGTWPADVEYPINRLQEPQ